MQKLEKWTEEELKAPVVCIRMPSGGRKGPFLDGLLINAIGLFGLDAHYHHDAVLVSEVMCP